MKQFSISRLVGKVREHCYLRHSERHLQMRSHWINSNDTQIQGHTERVCSQTKSEGEIIMYKSRGLLIGLKTCKGIHCVTATSKGRIGTGKGS